MCISRLNNNNNKTRKSKRARVTWSVDKKQPYLSTKLPLISKPLNDCHTIKPQLMLQISHKQINSLIYYDHANYTVTLACLLFKPLWVLVFLSHTLRHSLLVYTLKNYFFFKPFLRKYFCYYLKKYLLPFFVQKKLFYQNGKWL